VSRGGTGHGRGVDALAARVASRGFVRARAPDAGCLCRVAPYRAAQSGERARSHLLQPTALVNEALVRLLGEAPVDWVNRAHFFGFSARLMRQILIDFARAQETGNAGTAARMSAFRRPATSPRTNLIPSACLTRITRPTNWRSSTSARRSWLSCDISVVLRTRKLPRCWASRSRP